MIDVDQAYDTLFAHARPLESVQMPLQDAVLRTLAAPVSCDTDHPPFDRSVMDGFAVRSADVADAPVTLRLVGQIAAGTVPAAGLGAGEAMQINTGAPVPEGADAVVRVEVTACGESSGEVLIREPATAGQFITPRGTYVSAGQVVLAAGSCLTPLTIGAAAAAGAATVTVYRCPRVAILPTGDELIDIDAKITGAQIRNSNQYLLESLVRSARAVPLILGTAPDDATQLRDRVAEGLRADVLCVTGGVSMGAFDFVPDVLRSCGATFHIHKMAIKPGRPTIFATAADGTLIFALPGNPASALVGFELLVRPALAALEGRSGMIPAIHRARLEGSLRPTGARRTYYPAEVNVSQDGGYEVKPLSWHGSGDSFGMAMAGGLIVRPPHAGDSNPGDTVGFHLLDRR